MFDRSVLIVFRCHRRRCPRFRCARHIVAARVSLRQRKKFCLPIWKNKLSANQQEEIVPLGMLTLTVFAVLSRLMVDCKIVDGCNNWGGGRLVGFFAFAVDCVLDAGLTADWVLWAPPFPQPWSRIKNRESLSGPRPKHTSWPQLPLGVGLPARQPPLSQLLLLTNSLPSASRGKRPALNSTFPASKRSYFGGGNGLIVP